MLGNTKALSVIGDGTPVQTGGRAYGKFLCDCRKRGDWKCACRRQFSDPDANYGWDSEKYYYGRTLYMISAADSAYNLPLYPRLLRASHHDSVSWICTYRELRHWYADWKLGEAILDSAHDALPIYTLPEHEEQFRLAQQKRFGASSEKTNPDQLELDLFNEAEVLASPEVQEPDVETITHSRKKSASCEMKLEQFPVEPSSTSCPSRNRSAPAAVASCMR